MQSVNKKKLIENIFRETFIEKYHHWFFGAIFRDTLLFIKNQRRWGAMQTFNFWVLSSEPSSEMNCLVLFEYLYYSHF